MTNLRDCLETAIKAGKLDRVRGQQAQMEFDRLVAENERILPRAQAEVAAAQALKEATKASVAARRHTVIAQVQTMTRLKAEVMQSTDPAKVLKLGMEYDDRAARAGFRGLSARSMQDALIDTVNAGLRGALEAVGSGQFGNMLDPLKKGNLLGVAKAGYNATTGRPRDPALLKEVYLARRGAPTTNPVAKEVADAFEGQQERLRNLFNAQGGNIGKLENRGMAQTHEPSRILKAGEEVWTAKIMDTVDWSKTLDLNTGKPFVSQPGSRPAPERVAVMLKDIFQSVTKNGWNTREPSMIAGGRALYNRRADHRQLHFTAEGGWEYNQLFGAADPLTTMLGELHSMARDIGLMMVYGPNPKMGIEFAAQVARKKAHEIPNIKARAKMVQRVDNARDEAQVYLMHLDGSVNIPASAFWAKFWGANRGLRASTQLGGALLASTGDLVSMGMGAKVSGLRPGHLLARSMSLMANPASRREAANLGHIADSVSDMGGAATRAGLDSVMPGLVNRLTTTTMRLGLLAHWTDMNRVAIKTEFSSRMGLEADKPFDQIDRDLHRVLDQRGITATDWDIFRAPEYRYSPNAGANGGPPLDGGELAVFLSPHWFLQRTKLPAAQAEALALRIQMAMNEQVEILMPTRSIELKVKTVGRSRPGTYQGEAIRAVMQYKNYPISFMINQYRRTMAIQFQKGGARGVGIAATYAVGMAGLLTLVGAFNTTTKDVTKGRDPRDWTDPKNWGAFALQGGAAGVFGDFIYASQNIYGQSLASTFAGPTVGLIGNIGNLTIGNLGQAIMGEDTHIGREIANFIRYNTPVLSSLWYARLAFERLVADVIQLALDPEAEKQFAQQVRKLEKERGQGMWFMPGTKFPQRAPDLSNIAGTP